MPLPKKIKKTIPLTPQKTLMGRREELLDKINKDGTYLPKSLLHADLDRGFLDGGLLCRNSGRPNGRFYLADS